MRNITVTFERGPQTLTFDGFLIDDWVKPNKFIIEADIDEDATHKIDDKTPQFMRFEYLGKIISGMFISAEMSSLVSGMIWVRFESVGKIEVIYK